MEHTIITDTFECGRFGSYNEPTNSETDLIRDSLSTPLLHVCL